ncbi:lactadherin-like [Actinia tenebrosa]|uniref:Lactadherin-like n=1 Tax=Actinia tenebrosa TaxID=6105 RepID=A0A6P8IDL9_ACTTE|nr:lactadherin-like [Actinia tenebrosa]
MSRTCELSDTDHVGFPDHVVVKEGAEYCPIKNPCTSSSCTNLQICKPDFSWDTFACFNTCASCPAYKNCVQDPLTLALKCSGLSPDCCMALGMEDGRINDSAITASSVYAAFNHDSFQGRLNNKRDKGPQGYHGSAWSAKVNQVGEYLQVELGLECYITKVATQGRDYLFSAVVKQWVKTYSLQYGLDGVAWNNYTTGGELKIFTGNTDTTSIVTNTLAAPFKARFVRIVVQSWSQHISMRAELYGCQASN